MRAVWGGVATVAVVAALVLGYAVLVRGRPTTAGVSRATTATVRATATATPNTKIVTLPTLAPVVPAVAGTPIAWQRVGMPFPAGNVGKPFEDGNNAQLVVAPSDGATAYLCNVKTNDPAGRVHVWMTNDHGVTWNARADILLPGASMLITPGCSIAIDATTPTSLAAAVRWQDLTTHEERTLTFASADGGASWHTVSSSPVSNTNGAVTVGGKTYSIISTVGNDSLPYATYLAVSTNGGATWTQIDTTLANAGHKVVSFWVRPDDGTLLVSALETASVTSSRGNQSSTAYDTLWQSSDSGTHWTQLPAPALPFFMTLPPVAGRPWAICGYKQALFMADEGQIACTDDGGRTWVPRPTLHVACTVDTCQSPVQNPPVNTLVLTPDGDLLAFAPRGIIRDGVLQRLEGYGVYRLLHGSVQWEDLGKVSVGGGSLIYTMRPSGAVVLWAVPMGGSGGFGTTGGYGVTLGHTPTGYDIYAADLP